MLVHSYTSLHNNVGVGVIQYLELSRMLYVITSVCVRVSLLVRGITLLSLVSSKILVGMEVNCV